MATQQQKISALYSAFFNRAPDAQGMNFWDVTMTANGGDFNEISQAFSTHPVFTSTYGGMNNQQFVEAIYQNMLSGAGDAAGIAYWIDLLDNSLSRSDMVANFVTLSLDIDLDAMLDNGDLTQDDYDAAVIRQQFVTNRADVGISYIEELGVYSNVTETDPTKVESDPSYLSSISVIEGIDHTTASVTTAINELITSRPEASSVLPSYDLNYNAFISDNNTAFKDETAVYDFNGNGLLDTLVVSVKYLTFDSTPIEIALNNGDGTFTESTSSIITGDIPEFLHSREITQADYNGDGFTDFYIIGHGYDLPPWPGEQNVLLLSNGDGTWRSTELPDAEDFTHSVTSADIDNDGDIDIYVGNIYGGNEVAPYFLVNNGLGDFTQNSSLLPETLQVMVTVFTTSLFFDANNDGWNDLVVGSNGDAGQNRIYLNQQGSFSDSAVINLPDSTTFSSNIVVDSQAYDFNNDGYLDLMMLSTDIDPAYEDNQIQILINDGNSGFTDDTDTYIPNYLHTADWSKYVHIGDINNDGYDDLLLEIIGTYYLNDGTGIFSTTGTLPSDVAFSGYEVANFDSDEQLEILLTNGESGFGIMDIL